MRSTKRLVTASICDCIIPYALLLLVVSGKGGGSGGKFSLWFPVTPDQGLLHLNVSGRGERIFNFFKVSTDLLLSKVNLCSFFFFPLFSSSYAFLRDLTYFCVWSVLEPSWLLRLEAVL
jgi:hypothetical protein